MAPRDQMRASDADREAAVERLHEAAAEGRLGTQELDDRLTRAFAALTYGDLDRIVDDLPVPVAPPPRRRAARVGFWRRLGASVIDGLIVGVVTGILSAILHGAGSGLGILVSIGYFVYFEGGAQGGGPGKQALGIKVVDSHTGSPIGYPRAFARWVGRILSTIPLFLGYFWMLWDPERQCWHDKLAGDVVVYRDERRELPPGPGI